ncbi:PASTA domain-containing protein [Herbiconiux ginsengi]|uniref:non-specific serine/threonine protein kinase n=1 Tax=Herbiconiux ginsengi TaxID=381665 RepID=A0A1H3T4S2_9MICO|nr:PASTA domain-containing protein [Herbiconiux ginsengi]SDZ45256.1 PASTA domain, binds beta-lactams [Herbiconiux ginsengi]
MTDGPDRPDPPLPALPDRYRVGALIRSTPVVRMHRGYDEQVDRPVRVTFLRPDHAGDPAHRVLFDSTVAVAVELTHPAVVAVYDVKIEDAGAPGDRWVVGELVDAPTLDEFIVDSELGRHWPHVVLGLARQLANALQAAHAEGIVHGNLGPSTVFLEQTTVGLRVRVDEFGPQPADLAFPLDPAMAKAMWHTFAEQIVYPSPEQRAGRAPTRRSDVYGFGCALAALILLDPVERADDPLSDALARIAARAMSERPVARQNSFVTVLTELDRIETVDDGGGGDDPDSAAGQSPTEVLSFAPPTGPAQRDTGSRPRAQRTRHRRSRRGAVTAVAVAVMIAAVAGFGWANSGVAPRSASVIIPSVAGQTVSDATAALTRIGIGVAGQVSRDDGAVAAGLVTQTDPAAGSQVTTGQTVTLVISTGQHVIAVPQLQGLDLAAARDLLASNRLEAGEIVERDGLNQAGMVLESSPAYGASLGIGGRIDLVVSSGDQRVPGDLVGQAGAAAAQALASAGLSPQVVREKRSDAATDVVVAVSPPTGSSVPLGSIVTITISEWAPPPSSPQPTASPSQTTDPTPSATPRVRDQ